MTSRAAMKGLGAWVVGMGAPAGAAIRLDAEPQPMATGAVAG